VERESKQIRDRNREGECRKQGFDNEGMFMNYVIGFEGIRGVCCSGFKDSKRTKFISVAETFKLFLRHKTSLAWLMDSYASLIE
jgi:hypothetical protein